ncbi:MAG: right-handed parallel beta-helix repeat-containing protein [Methanophagales archaeon]|nr:right-handed parallel beta-helix repeat-containing protein [Methanophagales archaeon]
MNKKYGILIICAVILFLGFIGTASAKTWYVDDSGGANFTRIQDAITSANSGDAIIVRDGNYLENVKVNKSLTIRSKNGPETTIVLAENPDDPVFNVTADYVNISGFTVENATGWYIAGIYLYSADYCNISSNNCSNNSDGIYLRYANNNSISNNNCSDNNRGILLSRSDNNNISNNNCSNNLAGFHLFKSNNNDISNNNCSNNQYVGILLVASLENTITGNRLRYNKDSGILLRCGPNTNLGSSNNIIKGNIMASNNRHGIYISDSSHNSIKENNVKYNGIGISIYAHPHCYHCPCSSYSSMDNVICLNNFINNTNNVFSESPVNAWSSTEKITYAYQGKPYKNYLGNYWDDYTDIDADSNGIWDNPRKINVKVRTGEINSDKDIYPLLEPFENYAHSENYLPKPSSHEENAYSHLYEVMDNYNEVFDVYTDGDAAGNHYIPSGWMGDWKDITFNGSYTADPHSGANCIKINYAADYYLNNHYIPSGWLGDWNDITFNDSYTADPHSGANCTKINYSANGSQGNNWSGIYWQDPENNWGDKIGGFNLSGAAELTFWAKGEKGGEKMEFKVGGINRHAYNVYTDKNAANNHYFPSGWYNGASNMLFNDNWMDNPHSGTSCIKVRWNGATGNDGWKWNGVMWQNPENNWAGDSGYGYNLTGATKLTFWARTDEPGLKVKFLIGYPDDTSGEVLINERTDGWVELYPNWTQYEIDLSGRDISDIAGGFAFVFNDVNDPDPDGCTFYLDDIKYDKVTLYDPDKPYQDSCGPVSSGIITLTNNWQQYAINLTNEDLSHLIGGFCWVANKDNNPDGCTFYLDDIKYEYKYEDKRFNVYTDAQQNWAGIYWQDPENNWGNCSAGGYNLTGATNLSFWAKGANGTEKMEFKIGGIGWDPKTDQQIALYPDSLHPAVSTGIINLTTEWKQYTIDLTGRNLSRVIGGFCWVTNTTLNPNGCTFYLDDIRYNKQRLDDLRFLVSYETTSASEDRYMKNVAFTYDNALVMLAFMARGSEEDWRRAKILGDSFVYCQNHDRYFSDGRLRNAYQAGDIADYQGKARLPGWWNDSEQKWFEDKGSVGSSTGNVAWTMIALLCYYEATGNTTYLESAERFGDWIYNNTYDTRYYGGYTGGYEGWGANQTKPLWKSTEHNLDVYVAFMQLYRTTNDSVWQSRAIHAKNFAIAMWNEDGGHFWTGTKDNETINKDVLPADVNTWGLMVLGKEYGAGVKWVEDNCKVTSCPEGCGFKGFDFNNDKDGVWFEGTAHMCIAYQIMNETNKSDDYISEIRKAQTSASNNNGKGIVAACHDGVTTGFDWVYNNRLHIGATSWYIFAERGYNPYWQINTSDT